MKSFIVLHLCWCLFLSKSITGQHYDQKNDWSWMHDKAYLAPENEDHFHEHYHHHHHENPNHSSIYSNIEPLENIFNEEIDHEIYNKANLFKIGEAFAPAKPEEPRNEVIVDDVYEQHPEKHELPSHLAAGFGEIINAHPHEGSSQKTPQMFDTFTVEKMHTFIGPENKVQREDIKEIFMHIVDDFGHDYANATVRPVLLDEDEDFDDPEETNENEDVAVVIDEKKNDEISKDNLSSATEKHEEESLEKPGQKLQESDISVVSP